MISVSIVDDHRLVAEGFARLINQQPQMCVVSRCSSYSDACQSLTLLQPDIMLIDISLPDKNGIELIEYIVAHYPEVKTITLSMYDTEPYIGRALDAGANGYLSKRVAPDELIIAINEVYRGALYLGADIKTNRRYFKEQNKQLELTAREREVLTLLAQSKAIKTIASILQMQPKTVHAHKANIAKKLQISSLEEMRKIAIKLQLIGVDDLT